MEAVRRLIGKGSDKLIPEAFGCNSNSPSGKKLDDLKRAIFKKRYLPTLQPAPGARALLRRLRQDEIKLIVATSADKDDVLPLLERAAVADLIPDITSADDVDASKPDPEIVQAAVTKVRENVRDVVMLGDTPYDVEAANRAGVRIIAVRCGGWADSNLQGSVAIYDDPAGVLANWDEIVSADG